jgi:acyl-CoA reductase-like NAD-dependent aldehyde dehydrogenase
MNTVLRYIETGKREGAELLTGGKRAVIGNGKGFFVEPTVFGNVSNEMTVAREEIFGPVLATLNFDDLDQVAALANQTSYGLAAAIWTRDIKKAHALSRRLKAGTVWINTYGVMDPALPFGGYKQSGYGRELGRDSLEHYTEVKTVWMNVA